MEVTNLPGVQAVQEQNRPIAPLAPTKPSQLLSLLARGTDCPGGFVGANAIDQRLATDGTLAPFAIPDGSVFVITGVEVRTETSPNINDLLTVGVSCGPGCMEEIVFLVVTTDGAGVGGASLQLNPGIPIKGGRTLCVADAYHGSVNTYATLRGYLTLDE